MRIPMEEFPQTGEGVTLIAAASTMVDDIAGGVCLFTTLEYGEPYSYVSVNERAMPLRIKASLLMIDPVELEVQQ